MKRSWILVHVLLVGCGDRITLGTLPGEDGTVDMHPSPQADAASDPRETNDASTDGGPAPWVPCGGKTCGATCTLCSPGDPGCNETAVLKFCHSSGECLPFAPACVPPPPYEPCAGKACGDSCKICNPADLGCVETAVVKQCNNAGVCSPAPPGC